MGEGGGQKQKCAALSSRRRAFCDNNACPFLDIFPMPITTETTDRAHIVTLQGQINSANAAAIEADVLALVDGGAINLVLDFSALDYISSAGLRVVLVLAKRLKAEGGQLVLCGMQPHVREVFDISGFLAILNVEPTRAEALARF